MVHAGSSLDAAGVKVVLNEQAELWAGDFGSSRLLVEWTGRNREEHHREDDCGLLVASFCSKVFEGRRNLYFIFPTLATQLARKYSGFRSILAVDTVGSRSRL
jgi:hypothetical protein